VLSIGRIPEITCSAKVHINREQIKQRLLQIRQFEHQWTPWLFPVEMMLSLSLESMDHGAQRYLLQVSETDGLEFIPGFDGSAAIQS
jgi:hypothetical protein